MKFPGKEFGLSGLLLIAACGQQRDILSTPTVCNDTVELLLAEPLPLNFTLESSQLRIPSTECGRAAVDLDSGVRIEVLNDEIWLVNLAPTGAVAVDIEIDRRRIAFELNDSQEIVADRETCRVAIYDAVLP